MRTRGLIKKDNPEMILRLPLPYHPLPLSPPSERFPAPRGGAFSTPRSEKSIAVCADRYFAFFALIVYLSFMNARMSTRLIENDDRWRSELSAPVDQSNNDSSNDRENVNGKTGSRISSCESFIHL